jgi:DNA helicase IV
LSAKPPPAVSTPLPKSDPEDASLVGLRAAEIVLKKLAVPRSEALRSVLATLQPDQFDVVSRPPGVDLIVQGHPGTGKTVVAAYRAAYLVSPERGDGRAETVLLVGPTSEYVAHVRGLLQPLDPEGHVVVTHISAVLDKTVDLKSQWSGGIGGDHNDIDARARQFAVRAEKLAIEEAMVVSGPNARRDHVKAIYTLMRSNGLPDRPISNAPDDIAWMTGLPEFDTAIRLRRYLPLMAQITMAFQPVPHTDQFQHIVVDEAQDVSPIEWNVLEQYLRPRGHWTLVGDMNQRRSDATYATWSDISDHLGLGNGDEAMPATVLRRGYRSTTPILRFADRLLPKAERGATSIQRGGPEPTPEHVPAAASLVPRALEAAQRLIRTYPQGTVAIITVDPGPMIQFLGKQGWRRGDTMNIWIHEDEVVRVFVPESARGLEFDAVVVVEPGAFPENLGREGQLYTSATRANRELAVVWHRDLPDGWRRSGRR